MPDANNDNLETLFQQAEAEGAIAQTNTQGKTSQSSEGDQAPLLNQPAECDHAGSDIHSRRWCKQCKHMICQFCWSVLDSNYCQDCMRSADLKIEEKVLVDDEGVTHHGRLLTPLGQFNDLRWIPNGKTTAKALSEMSMPELEEYVSAYKQAVYEAERAVDIRRIKLSSGLMELDERRAQERRRLRADKTQYPVKTVTLNPKTGKRVAKQASTQQTINMLDMLKAMQALKAKVAARTQQAPPASPDGKAKP